MLPRRLLEDLKGQKVTRSGRSYLAQTLTINDTISAVNALLSPKSEYVKDVARAGSCLFDCGCEHYRDVGGRLRIQVADFCAQLANEDPLYAQSLMSSSLYKPRVARPANAFDDTYNSLFDAFEKLDFTADPDKASLTHAVAAYVAFMRFSSSFAGEHEVSAMSYIIRRPVIVMQYDSTNGSLHTVVSHQPPRPDKALGPLRLLLANQHYAVIASIPEHLPRVKRRHVCRCFIRALRDLREIASSQRRELAMVFVASVVASALRTAPCELDERHLGYSGTAEAQGTATAHAQKSSQHEVPSNTMGGGDNAECAFAPALSASLASARTRDASRLSSLLHRAVRLLLRVVVRIQSCCRRFLVSRYATQLLSTCEHARPTRFSRVSTQLAVVHLAQRGRTHVHPVRRSISPSRHQGSNFGGAPQTARIQWTQRTLQKKLRFASSTVTSGPTTSL